jgi:hypothetical protein
VTATDESALLRFHRHAGTDHRGRTLAAIRSFGTDRLEGTHDFIQWLFPLPEPSGANPLAPILAPADIDAFLAEPALREELRRSLDVMLSFYGLERAGDRVDRGANYAARSAEWLRRPHNFLRISRILRSLSVLGCAAEARALLACLETIYAENADAIGAESWLYWQSAARPRG